MTAFPESEADRLNTFLDACVRGQRADPDGLDPALADTYERISALNAQSVPDSALMTDIWRRMMNTSPITSQLPTDSAVLRPAFARPPDKLAHNRGIGRFVTAFALLAVVLASVFGYRWYTGGSDPQPTAVPAAFQPAASPAATAGSTGCDLSDDIPIITDVIADQLPFEQTTVYVLQDTSTIDMSGPTIIYPGGTLILSCAGKEDVILAEEVGAVQPGPWAGTVQVSSPESTSSLTETYIDISNGRAVSFGPFRNSEEPILASKQGSPWVIGPSSENPVGLMIADLRTMEMRPFAEVAGIEPPTGSIVWLASPAMDGSTVIGFAEPGFNGRLITDGDAQGDLLKLGSSFDDTNWVSIPGTLTEVGGVSLSPDGTHAALVSSDRTAVVPDSSSIALIELASGDEVAATAEIPFRGDTAFVWVQDGTAVAFVDGKTVQTISRDGTGEQAVVFEAPAELSMIRMTWNPDVVVVTAIDQTSVANAENSIVYSVDVGTGDVHEFQGVDASANATWLIDAGALVMYQPAETPGETMNYAVFDPVTGDQIGEILDAPSVQASPRTLPTLGPRSVSVSRDGRVEVIAFGTQNIYSFTAGENGMTMQRIDSPEGLLSDLFLTANLVVSPHGTMLSLNGEEDEGRGRYVISLTDPAAGWSGWENRVVGERGRGLISFVEGVTN